MPSIRLVTFLTSLALVATLRAATPTPAENPVATPAPAGSPHSLKDTVPVESLGDSVVARRNGFEVVPGKDPNGWSFILEPYLWALGVDGTVGVKGFDTHVDYNPLMWSSILIGESWPKAKCGKGSGASSAMDFSPSSRRAAILPGRFTITRISSFSREWWSLRSLTGSLTTGAASSISTRARAITTSGSILTRALTMRAFRRWATPQRSAHFAPSARACKAPWTLKCRDCESKLPMREPSCEKTFASRKPILPRGCSPETVLEEMGARIAASLEPDFLARLRRDLAESRRLREAVRNADIARITKGVRGEFRALLNAVLDARLAEDRARVDARLTQDRSRIEARAAKRERALKLASPRPKRSSPRLLRSNSKTVSRHRNPVTSGGSIPSLAFAVRLTSLVGSSWHSRAMSADLGLALKSHGSPAARLASISRATFSWRQAIAISTWIT